MQLDKIHLCTVSISSSLTLPYRNSTSYEGFCDAEWSTYTLGKTEMAALALQVNSNASQRGSGCIISHMYGPETACVPNNN